MKKKKGKKEKKEGKKEREACEPLIKNCAYCTKIRTHFGYERDKLFVLLNHRCLLHPRSSLQTNPDLEIEL